MVTRNSLIAGLFFTANILNALGTLLQPGFVAAFSPTAPRSTARQTRNDPNTILMPKLTSRNGHWWRKCDRRAHSSSPLSHRRNAAQASDTSDVSTMLASMTDYFYSMVDPRTNRFFYRCLPESGTLVHSHCPIRDLGSAWDTANLLTFLAGPANNNNLVEETTVSGSTTTSPILVVTEWNRMYPRLSAAIFETIKAYSEEWIQFKDDCRHCKCVAIPDCVLLEPTSIAHSAFMILATVGAMRSSAENTSAYLHVPLDQLVSGILSMQKKNGAFAIHFGSDDIFGGIEFYPGEAILALLDVYRFCLESDKEHKVLSEATLHAIIPAVKRAFLFYSMYYHNGRVHSSYIGFFANWQVQSFAKLYYILRDEEMEKHVADAPAISVPDAASMTEPKADTFFSTSVAAYVFELCDAVTKSRSWQALLRGQQKRLSTVEIACGLEAIAEGTLLALEQLPQARSRSLEGASDHVRNYVTCIDAATNFLATVQNQVPAGTTGSGGLGHGLGVLEQRLDVTGHAVNALIKVHQVKQNAPVIRTAATPDGATAPNEKSPGGVDHHRDGDSHSDPGAR